MRLGKALFLIIAIGLLAFTVGAKDAPKALAGYDTVVVEEFTVEQGAQTADFPSGLLNVVHTRAVYRLTDSALFASVIDGLRPETPAAAKEGAAPPKKLLLSGKVVSFDKGSRTARWVVGMGAGSAKIRMHFTFKDAATGAEVLAVDQEGSFAGTFTVGGGSADKAFDECARKVVDGLIKQMKKNR